MEGIIQGVAELTGRLSFFAEYACIVDSNGDRIVSSTGAFVSVPMPSGESMPGQLAGVAELTGRLAEIIEMN